MVQLAESFRNKDGTRSRRSRSVVRRSLSKPQVCRIFVVVADVIRQQPLQVLFIERDHVVQQITPATLDPALGYAVLPRTLERGSQGSDRQGSNRSRNLCSIFGIAVKDKKPRRTVKRKRFP